MKPYLLSLGAGLLVGVIYGLLHVRSPAPPVVALVGLLGILLGEQLPPLVRAALSGGSVSAYLHLGAKRHVFDGLAHGPSEVAAARRSDPSDAG
jgi:XapX domain-containing protein